MSYEKGNISTKFNTNQLARPKKDKMLAILENR